MRNALDPSITNSIPCSGSRPRSTKSERSAVATVAFSVEPSHSPSGIFTPSVVIPNATIIIRPLQLQAVEHHHREAQIAQLAAHQLAQCLAGALHERPRHRTLRRRPRPDLDLLADRLLRAPVPARRHAGEHPLEHDPAQRITVSEVLIGLKLHLGLAVRGPHPRSPHLDTTAAERHLAAFMAVPDRSPLGVVLALGADDVVDLLGHQLLEHAKPDTDAQRQQAFLRCPNQLAQRFLHALREHGLITVASATGTLLLTAVPP